MSEKVGKVEKSRYHPAGFGQLRSLLQLDSACCTGNRCRSWTRPVGVAVAAGLGLLPGSPPPPTHPPNSRLRLPPPLTAVTQSGEPESCRVGRGDATRRLALRAKTGTSLPRASPGPRALHLPAARALPPRCAPCAVGERAGAQMARREGERAGGGRACRRASRRRQGVQASEPDAARDRGAEASTRDAQPRQAAGPPGPECRRQKALRFLHVRGGRGAPSPGCTGDARDDSAGGSRPR
jgi:hypothetical protein